MRTVLVDTNVLLRFLLEDDPKLSPKARELIKKAQEGDMELYFDEVMIAEAVWVLSSYYAHSKSKIVTQLKKILVQKWAINTRKKNILEALSLFEVSNIAYIDCWLFQVSIEAGISLESFDEKLSKMSISKN